MFICLYFCYVSWLLFLLAVVSLIIKDVGVKYGRSYKKHKHKDVVHESKGKILGEMYDKKRISYLSPSTLKFESGNTMEVGLVGGTHLGDFVYFFKI
jgi:hypothetical protein